MTRSQAQLDLGDGVGSGYGVNLLQEGILAADIVNTVSPTYARESLTPEYGSGMDEALRFRGDRYMGILNGIDTDLWNPATDPDLPALLCGRGPDRQGRPVAPRCARSSDSIPTARCSRWSVGSIR